jgi:hypothetical protein
LDVEVAMFLVTVKMDIALLVTVEDSVADKQPLGVPLKRTTGRAFTAFVRYDGCKVPVGCVTTMPRPDLSAQLETFPDACVIPLSAKNQVRMAGCLRTVATTVPLVLPTPPGPHCALAQKGTMAKNSNNAGFAHRLGLAKYFTNKLN